MRKKYNFCSSNNNNNNNNNNKGMKFEFDWENPNLWSSIGIKFDDLLLIILPNLNLIIVSVNNVFKL